MNTMQKERSCCGSVLLINCDTKLQDLKRLPGEENVSGLFSFAAWCLWRETNSVPTF